MYRTKHCTPELTLDPELNEIAQKYAEQLAASGSFEHSDNKLNEESLGENLYWQSGSNVASINGKPTQNFHFPISSSFYMLRFGSSQRLVR